MLALAWHRLEPASCTNDRLGQRGRQKQVGSENGGKGGFERLCFACSSRASADPRSPLRQQVRGDFVRDNPGAEEFASQQLRYALLRLSSLDP